MAVILLSILASVLLCLGKAGVFSWLQGRANSGFPTVLLGWLILVLWIGATGWVVVRLLMPRKNAKAKSKIAPALLLLLLVIPWIVPLGGTHPMESFVNGFGAWAEAVVDVDAVKNWRSGLTSLAASAPAPAMWPMDDNAADFGTPVSLSQGDASIAAIDPEYIRVFRENENVLFVWSAGRGGRLRFVAVGDEPVTPPAEFLTVHLSWRQVKPGVIVGVFEHHWGW